ncbi:MAG: flagellar FliJ family protein [Armatimonadota bacterium]
MSMADEDVARLERLLAWRRGEEDVVRQRETSAVRAVESARERLNALRSQLRACRECRGANAAGCVELIDAHHCAAHLGERAAEQERSLEEARRHLEQVRRELAEAGRRRLAVERMATARSLRLRDHERAVAQADLDESGRLRLLLEGD